MEDAEETPAEMFQRKLKVSSALSNKLVSGGLRTIEEVAYFPLSEFQEISGLSSTEAGDLRYIAKAYLLNETLDKDPDFW
ncbi:hypothetical protein [Piscinibacter sp. HJYY11]|uniref:hypothetical protein n=1 Tax=Piscinibacter sp. HJYY11 TaxID=2801333 RepID=UPI00191E0AD0|nr:hypothetical protein [Piscinibacter sp. HJYY11]MBL0729657.1 hypothetical protein [Piscinibacter sp. HJYY11]